MKLRHISLASLFLSAVMSGTIWAIAVFVLDGLKANFVAILTGWLLFSVAGLLAEIARRGGDE